jgi:hypothetical protein
MRRPYGTMMLATCIALTNIGIDTSGAFAQERYKVVVAQGHLNVPTGNSSYTLAYPYIKLDRFTGELWGCAITEGRPYQVDCQPMGAASGGKPIPYDLSSKSVAYDLILIWGGNGALAASCVMATRFVVFGRLNAKCPKAERLSVRKKRAPAPRRGFFFGQGCAPIEAPSSEGRRCPPDPLAL